MSNKTTERKSHPPFLAEGLLILLKKFSEEHSGIGDLSEEHRELISRSGKLSADIWYWGQVLHAAFVCGLISLESGGTMLKNNLRVAVRHINRHKLYSLINISGLAIGFACSMLIFLFIRNEFGYDRRHDNAGRIVRAVYNFTGSYPMGTPKRAHSHPQLAPTLVREFPEIESATRFSRYYSCLVRVEDRKFLVDKWVWADRRIFEVFTLPFVYGDPETALERPFSVVLDRETAVKLFGHTNPVGESLQFVRGRELTLRVTGVMENLPENSHFRPHFLGQFETQRNLGLSRALDAWDAHWFHTYLLLEEGILVHELEAKIQAFIERDILPLSDSQGWTYKLQPLTDIHLRSTDVLNNLETGGDIKSITICSLIASLILLIAGINFVNLSTARSFKRAREVGIRKVVGARRVQLINQFFGESMILTGVALMASVGLVILSLNAFAGFVRRDISAHVLIQPGFFLPFLAAVFAVGILSGCHPALYLSRFRPMAALRGDRGRAAGGFSYRNVLVLFQFAISMFLIISTLVVSGQLDFIRGRKLGFARERVVVVDRIDGEIIRKRDVVKSELLQYPGITGVTFSQTLPTNINWDSQFEYQGREGSEPLLAYFNQVDYDFVDVYEMEIAAGRNFSKDMATDAVGGHAFLLNETAVKSLGWDAPIGRKFGFPGSEVMGEVVGVVKDFNSKSLHFPSEPVALLLNRTGGNIYFLSIKIGAGDARQILAAVEAVWDKHADGYPFEYYFLDDAYNAMYRSEMELGVLFRVFTCLAVFISCLGLFGLASFTAERRTKEIGIRKVLGASVFGLTMGFSRSFLKWVVLANLISWPVAYYAMHRWLGNFAYRIDLGIGMFAGSALIALLIAQLTVGYQSVKAAVADPIESLRYE